MNQISDYILNGQPHGEVATGLASRVGFDLGLRRPFIDDDGRVAVVMNVGGTVEKEITNSQGQKTRVKVPKKGKVYIPQLMDLGLYNPSIHNAQTLTKDAWIELDRRIKEAALAPMQAWRDLVTSNPYPRFNAYAARTIEYQAMDDPGEATVSMDAIATEIGDRPVFDLRSIPLPLTHAGFHFSDRDIETSKTTGAPLPQTMIRWSGRRIGETIEKTTIGTVTGLTWGTNSTDHTVTGLTTSTVYGYRNHPHRITKTDLTAPTGTNPEAINTDILEMIELANNQNFYGPFILYMSTGYTRYINDDYFRSGSTSAVRSVRERLLQNEDIVAIRRLNFLTSGFQMLLIQLDRDTAEAVDNFGPTPVMWEDKGGYQKNFKVVALKVPLVYSRYNQKTPIIHGTTS